MLSQCLSLTIEESGFHNSGLAWPDCVPQIAMIKFGQNTKCNYLESLNKCGQKLEVDLWKKRTLQCEICEAFCLRKLLNPCFTHAKQEAGVLLAWDVEQSSGWEKWLENPKKEGATEGARPKICVLNSLKSLEDHQTTHTWERLGGLKEQLLEPARIKWRF